MQNTEIQRLQKLACQVRLHTLDALYHAGSGHPGSSFSCADILTWLYFHVLHIEPRQPKLAERDRFVLSKGHAAPAYYAALALRGFFPAEELKTLRTPDSRLQGHPCSLLTPGVDASSGSLGQGISMAAGMAMAAKLRSSNERVYALLGDGELEEGQVWEALMCAAHHKLENLCVLIDRNGLQIDGRTDQVMDPEPIEEKLAAFGLHVIHADGHDFASMEQTFSRAGAVADRPSAIILHTVKGKGISFMEDQVGWHGKTVTEADYLRARAELDAELRRWEEAYDHTA